MDKAIVGGSPPLYAVVSRNCARLVTHSVTYLAIVMSVGTSSPSPVQKFLILETTPDLPADFDFGDDSASALAFGSDVSLSAGFSGVEVREAIFASRKGNN